MCHRVSFRIRSHSIMQRRKLAFPARSNMASHILLVILFLAIHSEATWPGAATTTITSTDAGFGSAVSMFADFAAIGAWDSKKVFIHKKVSAIPCTNCSKVCKH
eukprot:TRINITY_DN82807_c0_g1_i1.p1 TRINITY_DN82807_c0_g1~~TRINITY_DN82807_c0_g1_i1.p1  ORF type:complete len:104 (+),score=19.44 TRINITY_DN82807_c0_g1_i1:27-338(+)